MSAEPVQYAKPALSTPTVPDSLVIPDKAKMSRQDLQSILLAISQGVEPERAAICQGISARSWKAAIDFEPIGQLVTHAWVTKLAKLERVITTAAQSGDIRACQWLLERLDPARYAGKAGAQVQVNLLQVEGRLETLDLGSKSVSEKLESVQVVDAQASE